MPLNYEFALGYVVVSRIFTIDLYSAKFIGYSFEGTLSSGRSIYFLT